MNYNHYQFVYRLFHANEAELLVKRYIEELPIEENSIWYHTDEILQNVLYKELIPSVYYVKYRYGSNPSITFQLNKAEDDSIDGWVYENNSVIESVQITISHYTKKEADEDQLVIKCRDYVAGELVYDRLEELQKRIDKRLKDKINKNYQGVIDVLLVGVQDWFVTRLCTSAEYADLERKLTQQAQTQLDGSIFRKLAIVDTDFVGKGQLLLFSNALQKV